MLGQEARSKSTRPEASRSQRERTIQTTVDFLEVYPPPGRCAISYRISELRSRVRLFGTFKYA